ncbi:MAG TPA: HAD family hydrolase [Polyangiaceae bacterium]
MANPLQHCRTAKTVRAPELLARFDELAARTSVLSLDCFDTILFRRTEQPVDVFFDLAQAEPFRALDFTAKLRTECEGRARALAWVRRCSNEVTLPEIYRAAFPDLDDAQVQALAAAELAAEKRACYAFPPTVELIRSAKARGLPIVIVSDTYLSEPELRELLAATLPSDAFAAIDRIFCSSEHGRSKAGGLFKDVLRLLSQRASSILHVGDSEISDLGAATAAGIQALRLEHHEAPVAQALRTQAMALGLMAPDVRHTRSLPAPFSGLLAASADLSRPEALLGAVGAGPILYSFARFLLEERAVLEHAGARPKLAFLMRDAYLPHRICRAIAGGDVGTDIAISRFAAYAASFRTRDDVERYLARSAGSGRLEPMTRQLLLPEDVAQRLIRSCERAEDKIAEFVRRVRDPKLLDVIFERSRAYRKRLLRYLERRVELAPGDTLVLVDLGYEGTAQRELGPVLADELGVKVTGRYLLASRVPGWQKTRSGLFDPSSCDDRLLATLVPYVALLEDICTTDDPSVIDYDDDGNPVFGERVIASEQYQRIAPIQAECERFAREAEAFFPRCGAQPSREDRRLGALAAFARLLFFPTASEIDYLEGFRLDMNLATLDSFELFDREKGLEALRRLGPFFMNPGTKALRTNSPIELRSAGIELSLSLFAQHRYALSVGVEDVSLRRESVPLLILAGRDGSLSEAEARATHDGYFSLVVPFGEGGFNVGVMFGKKYTWLQLQSIELVPTTALYRPEGAEQQIDASDVTTADGMRHAGGGLYECLSEAAFLMIAPKARPDAPGTFACRIVYRPLVARTMAVAKAAE